jgi:RNA-directed DNA polymerase
MLRGWYGYFRRVEMYCFKSIDGFIRRRLRAILIRRLKKKKKLKAFGKSHGAHKRWPNAFFSEAGLIPLEEMAKKESLGRIF